MTYEWKGIDERLVFSEVLSHSYEVELSAWSQRNTIWPVFLYFYTLCCALKREIRAVPLSGERTLLFPLCNTRLAVAQRKAQFGSEPHSAPHFLVSLSHDRIGCSVSCLTFQVITKQELQTLSFWQRRRSHSGLTQFHFCSRSNRDPFIDKEQGREFNPDALILSQCCLGKMVWCLEQTAPFSNMMTNDMGQLGLTIANSKLWTQMRP